MAVTIDDVKARVETDLDDPTLQRILDSAVAAVNRSAGNATSQTETVNASGSRWVVLSRRKEQVESITERRTYDSDAVTLTSSDYRQVGDYKLLRVADGSEAALTWGQEVVITYIPEIDPDIRDRVAIDLCQVDIEFRAYERESVGDWDGEQTEWRARRRELLAQVREGRAIVA